MAINWFIGWSMEDLQRELRLAQEDLSAGKSTTRAGAGDASVENRVEKSIEERIKMILRALYLIDPVAYPLSAISAISETRVAFRNPCQGFDNW
jgi:hypothetical protein